MKPSQFRDAILDSVTISERCGSERFADNKPLRRSVSEQYDRISAAERVIPNLSDRISTAERAILDLCDRISAAERAIPNLSDRILGDMNRAGPHLAWIGPDRMVGGAVSHSCGADLEPAALV